MRGLALSGRGSRVALAAAVLIISSVSFSAIAAWGACTVVPAPCQLAPVQAQGAPNSQATPTPQSSLSWQRSCDAYFNGSPAIPPTLTRPVPIPSYTGVVQQIQVQVQKDADCYYQGVDPNPFVPNPKNPSCPGNPNWGTACSLVPNPLNSNSPAELTQNYRGASCGSFMQIHSSMNDSGCPSDASTTSVTPPADVAAALLALPNRPSIFEIMKMDPAQRQALYQQLVTANPSLAGSIGKSSNGKSICMYMGSGATEGERERSWLRGAFVQALSYYENQVIQEITTDHQIQIPTGSPCLAMAQDEASFQKNQMQQSFSALHGFVAGMSNGSQKNIPDIINCTADWSNVRLPDGTIDRGQLRQSAQNLCAARTGLESAFTELAVCEIFERAQSDYDAKTGIPNVQPLLIDAEKHIEKAPYGSSGQGCRHDCMDKGSWGSFDRCVNNCYQKNLPLYWTKKFSNWWPTSGSTPFSCMGISLLFPPIAVGERKRRRKSKLAKRLARLMLILITAFALIWLSACSHNKNIPAIPVPAPSSGCSSGSSCANVGAGVIEGAQVGAGSSLAGATQAGNTASSLVGGGSGLSTAAAKGPGTPGAMKSVGSAGGEGGGSAMGLPQVAAAAPGGSGSGAFGGGSASGSDNSFGYGQDGGGALGPVAQASPAAGDGSSYSGGGGSGNGNSANTTNGLFSWSGAGGDGAPGGTNGENSFGKDIPPMASRDPANYFTMIDPSDSLFKKVTARYQQTAMQWASSNSMNAAPSSDIHGGVISVPARK